MLTLLITVALALGVSLVLPKTYKATSTLLLNYKGVDPLTGLAMPGQLLPGYMATQVDIIGSKNVALRVVDQLEAGAKARPSSPSSTRRRKARARCATGWPICC